MGPVIGGYITNADWRYCFVLCAGMAVISIGTIFLLRNDLKPGRVSLSRPSGTQTRLQALTSGLATLDFGGIVLFILGVGLVSKYSIRVHIGCDCSLTSETRF